MNNVSNSELDALKLFNQLIIDYRHEQRHRRRWRNVFRILMACLLLLSIYLFITSSQKANALNKMPHVGLIDINGNIFENDAGSADNFAQSLENAYKNKELKALIIRINSPGGSPVQADYMYNALQTYRQNYPNIKTYAVCVDICASAAYYVASAAETIYANPASIVGSIGVLYNGFGFVDLMQKMGVTRRLQTAGNYKGFLDPFSVESPEQKQMLQERLDLIHQQFIRRVKEGRGNRLKIDANTFSGLFWTGEQAKAQGLIDEFGSAGQIVHDVVKLKKVINYTNKPSVLERFSKNLGASMADHLPNALGLMPGVRE